MDLSTRAIGDHLRTSLEQDSVDGCGYEICIVARCVKKKVQTKTIRLELAEKTVISEKTGDTAIVRRSGRYFYVVCRVISFTNYVDV